MKPELESLYRRRLGMVNADSLPCNGCGAVHYWMTIGCKPVMVPDYWRESEKNLIRLPKDANYTCIG